MSDLELHEKTKDLTNRQKAEIQVAFARSIERQGDLQRAKRAYLQIIKNAPKQADAHHRLAIVCDRLGDFDQSAEHFRTALKLQPGKPDIFCDLGYSLYRQRRWAEAERNLKQAIALEPDHARAHNNLGLLMVQTNRFAEALASFRKAGCTPAAVHLNMAFVLTLKREWGAARDEYQRALADDPSSQQARERLQELNTLIAKVDPQSSSNANQVEFTSSEPHHAQPQQDHSQPQQDTADAVSDSGLELDDSWPPAPDFADFQTIPATGPEVASTTVPESDVHLAAQTNDEAVGEKPSDARRLEFEFEQR